MRFFLTLTLFLFFSFTLYGQWIIDTQISFQQTGIKKEALESSLRYQKGNMANTKATSYGFLIGLSYQTSISLSKKFLLKIGPFFYGGLGNYFKAPPPFKIDKVFSFFPGYLAQIKTPLTPFLSLYLKEELGFFLEYINWQYTYMVNDNYNQKFKETVLGPTLQSNLGLKYQFFKKAAFYLQWGYILGSFTSKISQTQGVKSQGSTFYQGFKINLGLLFEF